MVAFLKCSHHNSKSFLYIRKKVFFEVFGIYGKPLQSFIRKLVWILDSIGAQTSHVAFLKCSHHNSKSILYIRKKVFFEVFGIIRKTAPVIYLKIGMNFRLNRGSNVTRSLFWNLVTITLKVFNLLEKKWFLRFLRFYGKTAPGFFLKFCMNLRLNRGSNVTWSLFWNFVNITPKVFILFEKKIILEVFVILR